MNAIMPSSHEQLLMVSGPSLICALGVSVQSTVTHPVRARGMPWGRKVAAQRRLRLINVSAPEYLDLYDSHTKIEVP